MKRIRRQLTAGRGAAMTEMVLVMPLLLVILSLVFFFGRLMVRAQHVQVTSRYETWRDVIDAPGPAPKRVAGDLDFSDLEETFFAARNESFSRVVNDNRFPEETFGQIIQMAAQKSADAGALADALLYRPPGDEPRMSHGHREGFRVGYETDVPLWRQMEGPIRRHHARIGHEWHFSHNWTAGPDQWEGSAQTPHHLRALRDVFLEEFDDFLDSIDGESDPEYGDGDTTQRSTERALASFIRTMYLHDPGYRGPIVDNENQTN